MNTASKERTYKNTGENIPVEISGFKRAWNLKEGSVGYGGTYLGVEASRGSKFNGVIFQVPSSENGSEAFQSYDQREHYYCRKQVDIKDIEFLAPFDDTAENNHYWIYANKVKQTARPSGQNPIV